MTTMTISVAMCTYNGERYLREQLESIVRQQRLPDQVIICDDASRDGTLAICKAFAATAPFPVHIHTNDTTIGSTGNFARSIALCAGDIIVLSDQDDVWHWNKLHLIEQTFLDSAENGAVFSNGAVVSDTLTHLGYTLWDRFLFTGSYKANFMRGYIFDTLLNHNVVTGATMAFRSNLRDTILPIPLDWVHDSWIAITIASRSSIALIDTCLIDYRQHETQQIGGRRKSCRENIGIAKSVTDYDLQIRQYEQLFDYFIRHSDSCHAAQVADKIEHLMARTNIYNSSSAKKLVVVGRELWRRRYHKYSNGYVSVYKDLLLV